MHNSKRCPSSYSRLPEWQVKDGSIPGKNFKKVQGIENGKKGRSIKSETMMHGENSQVLISQIKRISYLWFYHILGSELLQFI